MTEEQGRSLTMQWDIVDRQNVTVLTGELYLGEERKASQRLYQGFTSSKPGEVNHFGNRSKVDFTDDFFKLTITNLKYTDEASYLLRVFIRTEPPKNAEAIITVKVVGKTGIMCFRDFVQYFIKLDFYLARLLHEVKDY